MRFFDTILNLEPQFIFGIIVGIFIFEFLGLLTSFILNRYWYYRLSIYFRDNKKDIANRLGLENKSNLQLLYPHRIRFSSTRVDEKIAIFPPVIKAEEMEKMCTDDEKLSELYFRIRCTSYIYHYFGIWLIFMIILLPLTLLIKTGSVLLLLFLIFVPLIFFKVYKHIQKSQRGGQ